MKALSFLARKAWIYVSVWLFVTAAFSAGAKTPDNTEILWNEPVRFHCPATAEVMPSGRPYRVMTWNVQFMTGGVYNFWDGPDVVPELDVEQQKKVSGLIGDVIRKESPDFVILQEVDRDTKTGMDQIQWLLEDLKDLYPCYSATAYSRLNHNLFLPERKRPAEQNLVTLSRYQMGMPQRHNLARVPESFIRPMIYQRAILETPIEISGGEYLHILNIHMDASFAQNTGISEEQVAQVNQRLNDLETDGVQWVIGGDFNVLPPGRLCSQ